MKTVSSVEANGSTFIFEPPVPLRDEDQAIPTLARVATFAWYGIEHPYGLGHELTEGGFEQLIKENSSSPQIIASRFTEALQSTPYAVTLVE